MEIIRSAQVEHTTCADGDCRHTASEGWLHCRAELMCASCACAHMEPPVLYCPTLILMSAATHLPRATGGYCHTLHLQGQVGWGIVASVGAVPYSSHVCRNPCLACPSFIACLSHMSQRTAASAAISDLHSRKRVGRCTGTGPRRTQPHPVTGAGAWRRTRAKPNIPRCGVFASPPLCGPPGSFTCTVTCGVLDGAGLTDHDSLRQTRRYFLNENEPTVGTSAAEM